MNTRKVILRSFVVCILAVVLLVVRGEEDTLNAGSCGYKNHAGECQSKQWRWMPDDTHPCNIERWSEKRYFARYGRLGLPRLHEKPIVLVANPKRNERLRNLTSLETLLDNLPMDMEVTLSSSNSFSEHRRTIPLTQYLDETVYQNDGETLPNQLSNESWYLFGETYTEDWKKLLTNYTLPPCHSCTDDLSALAFGIGNRGSGVQWHVHGPGFSEALHGRKHWILSPTRPEYDPDYPSRHWMEYSYEAAKESQEEGSELFECTIEPGEMIYFPDKWFHATINLDKYTAFVSTFTADYL